MIDADNRIILPLLARHRCHANIRRHAIFAAGLSIALAVALAPTPLRAEEDVFQPPSPLDAAPAPLDAPLSIARPTDGEPSRSLQPKPRKARAFAIDARAPAKPSETARERSAFFKPETGPANSRAADELIAVKEALAARAGAEKPVAATPLHGPQPAAVTHETVSPKVLPAVQEFCTNIADLARERRAAFQAERLRELEEQLSQRIAELDQRRTEVKQWLDRQKEAEKKADESVIAIFSRMRPEAAAAQLSAADESTAAAVLAKLNPRTASAILNEIDAAKAAKLTDAISRTRTAQLQPQSVSQ